MNNLARELAPISTAAWKEIDAEAQRILKLKLAGRKLVDFSGPLGAAAAGVSTGRRERLGTPPGPNIEASRRLTLPLVEMRVYFELSREELDAVERGAKDPELQAVIDAASQMAYAEDSVIFHGYPAAGITGIDKASMHPVLSLPQEDEGYPHAIAEATRLLRLAGVDGPYAIALGPRYYTALTQALGDGGYPILNVVRKLVDGPLVWAPAVNGAMVMSLRGGDFELTVGTDISIGYQSHTDTTVRLYLMETMTFRVLTPEAAVALAHKDAT
ncbi:MAG TPA: family 1 encapsulin nanocompartment shell protein [Methylomirabilota bacterium]|nr:family 1 encapsulin nanocompartment shell protein [Methylomirabilota bacterium]